MVYSVIQTTVSKFVPSPSKRKVQPESASLSVTVRFLKTVAEQQWKEIEEESYQCTKL